MNFNLHIKTSKKQSPYFAFPAYSWLNKGTYNISLNKIIIVLINLIYINKFMLIDSGPILKSIQLKILLRS